MTYVPDVTAERYRTKFITWVFSGFSIASVVGVPVGTWVANTFGWRWAFHLVNVCAMFAPDIVVFGGLFERWSDLLIPMIEERLRGNVAHEPELATASLGDEGKLVGAGMYGLRRAGGLAAVLSE